MHPTTATTAAPEIRQVSRARRRAREYGYTGEHFTGQEWLDLLEASGGVCLACGTTEEISVDHIIPLSLGGSNHIENIQPLCVACNCDKGTTDQDYRERSPPASPLFQAPVRLTSKRYSER
jgi:5-methylcytosine-specific restriction endonuclease McrA